jgi:hypothetical protein
MALAASFSDALAGSSSVTNDAIAMKSWRYALVRWSAELRHN